jgi:hypothetical protein
MVQVINSSLPKKEKHPWVRFFEIILFYEVRLTSTLSFSFCPG